MDEQTAFGMAIVAARERLGWTRTELLRQLQAEGYGMHMTTLRRLESGEQEPRLSELKALALVLGTTVTHLMNEADGYEDQTRKQLETLRRDYLEKLETAAEAHREFTHIAHDYRQAVEQAKASGWRGDELVGADVLLESFDCESGPSRYLIALDNSFDMFEYNLEQTSKRLTDLYKEYSDFVPGEEELDGVDTADRTTDAANDDRETGKS